MKHIILLTASLTGLFACTPTHQPPKAVQTGYLKSTITQAELANPNDYKRYFYTCRDAEKGINRALSTYFPLARESRLKENFGIYFQLDHGKAEPFDHIENRSLNTRGSRFEVVYRSYHSIEGSYIDLIAHQYRTVYYKNKAGSRTLWLSCKELG